MGGGVKCEGRREGDGLVDISIWFSRIGAFTFYLFHLHTYTMEYSDRTKIDFDFLSEISILGSPNPSKVVFSKCLYVRIQLYRPNHCTYFDEKHAFWVKIQGLIKKFIDLHNINGCLLLKKTFLLILH